MWLRVKAKKWQRFCDRVAQLPLEATALGGSPCRVLAPTIDNQQGVGWISERSHSHVPIVFDDGTRWLARIPPHGSAKQSLLTNSDYATRQVLHTIAPALIPKTWKAPDEDSELGGPVHVLIRRVLLCRVCGRVD